MKVQKLGNFGNKSGLTGCKWSSLNAPGTQTPLSHPILKLGEFPFLSISPLGTTESDLCRCRLEHHRKNRKSLRRRRLFLLPFAAALHSFVCSLVGEIK